MRRRRGGTVVASALFVVVVIIAGGAVALEALTSSPGSPSGSSTPGSGRTSGTSIERSGPISTFPAAWNNPCGFPVHGNVTTTNGIASSFNPGVANFSLSELYSKIVNSAAFTNVSKGLGWVTTSWSIYQVGGPSGSYTYVAGQFDFISADHPVGYAQANYNLETGAVTVDYETGLVSSCPAIISSSYGANLVMGSPSYYTVGEPVDIVFSVTDYRVADMSVTSSTSCMGNFTILQGIGTTGPEVYDSTKHPGCGGSPLSLTLGPGQSYNQTRSWNQTTDAGAQVLPGAYEIMSTFTGSPGSGNPVGVVYVGAAVSQVNSAILRTQFYYQGNLGNNFASPGQQVKVVWVLTNNGQQVYDLQTSACSYGYRVLDLAGALIYNSTNASCGNQMQDNPAPPMGGISHVSYWNQTNHRGGAVGPGFYRFVIELHVWSGGHEFNLTGYSDLQISNSNSPSSIEQIGVGSSSICTAGCSTSGPYLTSSVYANGNLKSLTAYLGGVLIGTENYNLACPDLTCQLSFNMPIDNSTIPIFPGVSYDLVFVGTFQDGLASISWANPLNPAN